MHSKTPLASSFASRRTLLKASVSCAALVPLLREFGALAANDTPTRKVVFLFFPHGTAEGSGFWPGEKASLTKLEGVLAPLQAYVKNTLIVGSLSDAGGYGHQGSNTAVLTGRGNREVDPSAGFQIPSGPSIDWMVARRFNEEPLVVGYGASKDGNRDIVSWSEGTGSGKKKPELSLTRAFQSVYGRDPQAGTCVATAPLPSAPPPMAPMTPGATPTRLPSSGAPGPNSSATPAPSPKSKSPVGSVLDAVAADIGAVKKALPSWSRTTLDEQLDAVRELESKAAASHALEEEASFDLAGDGVEPCYVSGATSGFHETSARFSDLISASFASGARHAAVLQHGNASGDGLTVPDFGGYHGEIHQLPSGPKGAVARVTRMQAEIFKAGAYLIDRLAQTKDASGASVLESTLVYICTDCGVSNASADPHIVGNACVVLIDRSGTFATGRAMKGVGSFAGMLVHAAQYAGLNVADLGGKAPTAGVRKA